MNSAPAALVETIFSSNFMRCLTNQLVSSDRYLHRNAEKAIRSIYARVETEPDVAIMVLKCLLRPPNGRANFDQITRTKTVEKLLSKIADEHLSGLLQIYSEIISKPHAEDEKAATLRRQIAADHLLITLRSKQACTRDGRLGSFIRQMLALFARHAYFTPKQEELHKNVSLDPLISEATRSTFQNRILSCLTHLVSKCTEPASFVHDLVHYIRFLDQEDTGCILLLESDVAISKTLRKGWEILQKIHTKEATAKGSHKQFLAAFELLYALTILQIYNGDADAASMLHDLEGCYDTLIKHRSRSRLSNLDDLLEILLGFAAKQLSLFRQLAAQVFSKITTDLSEAGLGSMIKVHHQCIKK